MSVKRVRYNGKNLRVDGKRAISENCCPAAFCDGKCCTECYDADYEVKKNSVSQYTNTYKLEHKGSCCWCYDGDPIPDFFLSYDSPYSNSWFVGPANPTLPGTCSLMPGSTYDGDDEKSNNFNCKDGGTIEYEVVIGADTWNYIWVLTPCQDCDDCPPA